MTSTTLPAPVADRYSIAIGDEVRILSNIADVWKNYVGYIGTVTDSYIFDGAPRLIVSFTQGVNAGVIAEPYQLDKVVSRAATFVDIIGDAIQAISDRAEVLGVRYETDMLRRVLVSLADEVGSGHYDEALA